MLAQDGSLQALELVYILVPIGELWIDIYIHQILVVFRLLLFQDVQGRCRPRLGLRLSVSGQTSQIEVRFQSSLPVNRHQVVVASIQRVDALRRQEQSGGRRCRGLAHPHRWNRLGLRACDDLFLLLLLLLIIACRDMAVEVHVRGLFLLTDAHLSQIKHLSTVLVYFRLELAKAGLLLDDAN